MFLSSISSNPEECRVRDFSYCDIAATLAFLKRENWGNYTSRCLKKLVISKTEFPYVAEWRNENHELEIIGFLCLAGDLIFDFHVCRRLQDQGVGRRMVSEILRMSQLKAKPHSHLCMAALERDLQGQLFLQRCGLYWVRTDNLSDWFDPQKTDNPDDKVYFFSTKPKAQEVVRTTNRIAHYINIDDL